MFCITTHAEDLGELYKIIAKGTPVGKNDSGLSFRERIFLGEALRLRVDPYFVYPEFVPERGHRLDHRAQLPIGFRS